MRKCLNQCCRKAGQFAVDSVRILVVSAIESNLVWSQELQVHWPQSWHFLSAREVLLETFRPKIFSVSESTIFLRFGEDQDIRVSQHGLHFRILTLANVDNRISEGIQSGSSHY